MKKSTKWREKGCNMRVILEGHVQLLVHCNVFSVAVVTIGRNFFSLLFPVASPPVVNGRSWMKNLRVMT